MSLCTSSDSGTFTFSSPATTKQKLTNVKHIESLTDGHVLCEGNFASLLDELVRLHSIVEIELDLLESLEHTNLVVDGCKSELFFHVFLLVGFALQDLLVTVLGLSIIIITLTLLIRLFISSRSILLL